MVMILANSVCHQSDGIGRSVEKQNDTEEM